MKINSFYFFLFLWLLRCFTSPGLLYIPMYSVYSNSTLLKLGSPIRKFPGQRLLGTSPKLIAPCNVLHRLLVSRHPSYALILYTAKTQNCALLWNYTKRIISYYYHCDDLSHLNMVFNIMTVAIYVYFCFTVSSSHQTTNYNLNSLNCKGPLIWTLIHTNFPVFNPFT